MVLRDHAFDDAGHMDAGDVGYDVDEIAGARFRLAGLLLLNDGLVLEKSGRYLIEKLLRGGRIVLAVAVCGRPEIMAARLGFGRQTMEQAQREAALAIPALVDAAPDIHRATPLDD